MALTDRLFGRGGTRLDLAAVQARFADAVRLGGEPDPDRTRARIADRCRDAGLEPMLPEEFDAAGLDAEGHRRLAVLAEALELAPVRAVVAHLAAARPAAELVAAAFPGLARETPLLTPEVLRQSDLRVEELARRFAAALGAGVEGETPAASKQRLARLDYARLLADADKARTAAANRAARLRELQDEQEKRRSPRGKW